MTIVNQQLIASGFAKNYPSLNFKWKFFLPLLVFRVWQHATVMP